MKKFILTSLTIIMLAGCSASPFKSDRISTIGIGDTKEHVIGVVGFPDNIVNQGQKNQILVYKEGHWFTKGSTTHSIYLKNNKVSLIKNEDVTIH